MTATAKPVSDPHLEEEPEAEAAAKDSDAFRTIGEAANELGLKPHVLRFWETKFDNLTPMKRADGRRYYRPEDMDVLRTLQNLRHVQGLTIKGAIKALEDNAATVTADAVSVAGDARNSVQDLQDKVRNAVERGEFRSDSLQENLDSRARLETLLVELTRLKSRVDAVRSVG